MPRIQLAEESQVLGRRQVLLQRRALELDTDALAVVAAKGCPSKQRRTAGRLQQPLEHLDGRALTGTVTPEQTETAGLLDLKTDAIDRSNLWILLDQLSGFENVRHDVLNDMEAGRVQRAVRGRARSCAANHDLTAARGMTQPSVCADSRQSTQNWGADRMTCFEVTPTTVGQSRSRVTCVSRLTARVSSATVIAAVMAISTCGRNQICWMKLKCWRPFAST